MAEDQDTDAGSAPTALSSGTGELTKSGTGGVGTQQSGGSSGERERFEGHELAIVLSHFDLGIIDRVKEFPKGSRRAPKLVIKADRGAYLIKRRAQDKCDPGMVAFAQYLQLHLASKQFPLPHLIGTKGENNSMLQMNGYIYEVFEFISGTRYDKSLEATHDAGRILALFHKLVHDFESEYQPPSGTYHGAKIVAKALDQVPRTLERVDPVGSAKNAADIQHVVGELRRSYNEAADKVNALGLSEWPEQIIHSDWHPGNMLYLKTRVVAVIDYDAARYQQPIIDTANGALQFSVIRTAESPDKWPDYIDESRYKRFLMGYDDVNQLTQSELGAVPWLMMEAMIAESSIPVANAGKFAHIGGLEFLRMVLRKVEWLRENAEKLASALD